MDTSSSPNPPIPRVNSSFSMLIASAIRDKSCPICLTHIDDRRAVVLPVCMHVYCIHCLRKWSQVKRNCPLCNAQFHSWFFKFRVSATKFELERLPNLDGKSKRNEIQDERSRFPPNRFRSAAHSVNQQSRQLPWRRSFGGSRFMPYDQERVLRWRASIYNQRLQAVPLPSRNFQEQNILRNRIVKETIQQRIEPWITRELQAILQDPDPSVIVHLATSLYILSLEEKLKASSGCHEASSECHAVEERFLQQLRPFLQDQTDMFWHELRCFARSSFEMATYDSVVEYKHLE